jgi:hypothetical protein
MSSSEVTRTPVEKRLEGIGGWLILLAVAQVLGPVQFIASTVEEYVSLPSGAFSRFPLAVSGDLLLRTAYVGLLVYAAYLFFNKRAEFPGTYIVAVAVGLALPFVIGVWVTLTTGINTLGNLGSWEFLKYYLLGLVVGVLWISYLLNSIRVKNTFVR